METTPQSPPDSPASGKIESVEQELLGISASTAAAHGAVAPGSAASPPPPRRGPGRPPTHGRYAKGNGSNGKNPVPLVSRPEDPVSVPSPEVAPEAPPRAPVPPDLLERAAVEVCGIAEDTAQGFLRAKAAAAKLTGPEVSAVIDSAALGEPRKKLVGELAPHAVAEFGMDPSVSPTACIGVIFGFWALSVFRAAKALESAAEATKAPPPNATAPQSI